MRSRRRSRGGLEEAVVEVLSKAKRPMTTAEVREALGGDLAYTTVMTVLARLHGKSAVTRQAEGRGYAYAAIRDPAERTARRMQHLLAGDADSATVLTRFVDNLSPADEATLRALLEVDRPSAP
ncbi:BlaI/MecI/CopY family transcriptional regulator [Microlunatus elymi]|uniref:BlaI/MecI/CopY family transcriptional regulator n=1 Tax=Microlunatus elymi TaxID=2596828 RepID=UPI001D1917AF|nr:BlaI/MecI/CopY family transcriptional regulator [Microlunatus elymi]